MREIPSIGAVSIEIKVITLALVSSNELIVAGIRVILRDVTDVELVGEAQCLLDAQRVVVELQPRILLADIEIAEQLLEAKRKNNHGNSANTIIIVLVDHEYDAYLANMIDKGAAGIVSLSVSIQTLIDTLHQAARDRSVFTAEQYSRAHSWHETVGDKLQSLTIRERQILKMLAVGLDTMCMANILGIKPRTIDFHITNILQKLEANSRLEAAIWVYRNLPDNLEKLLE